MKRHSKYLFVSSGHEGQGKMYTINTLGLSLFFILVCTFSAIGIWSVISGALLDLPSKNRVETVVATQKKIKTETKKISQEVKGLKKDLKAVQEEYREKLPMREVPAGNKEVYQKKIEKLSLPEFVHLSRQMRGLTDSLITLVDNKNSFFYSVPTAIPFTNDTRWFLKNLYGKMKDPHGTTEKMHQGIDFAAVKGTLVRASAGGVVQSTKTDRHFGKTVIVRHRGGLSSVYAHLGTISVQSGERIDRGDVLGTLGESGWTTSPLLHFEIRKGGRPIDPTILLRSIRYN